MSHAVRHAVLLAASFLVLVPFLWMLVASVMPHQEIMLGGLRLLPEEPAFRENYGRVIADVPIPRYLMNGALVCTAIFVLQVLVAVPAAYALAKLQFRGRDAAMAAVLLGLMVPAHVPAIPVYVAFYKIGLINTYAALILPHVASVFGIFLLRQYFRRIPDETLQAARLDGLSELEIVWRIATPFALPAIVAFGLFSFVVHWNDLFCLSTGGSGRPSTRNELLLLKPNTGCEPEMATGCTSGSARSRFSSSAMKASRCLSSAYFSPLSVICAVTNPSTCQPASELMKRCRPRRNNPAAASNTIANATSPTTSMCRNRC